MVIPECLGIAQSFVVTNDSLGVIAGIEADAAEVVTGLEAVECGAVVAVPAVCGQGKGVVREVDVVFVEGFAEEQGVEGPDVKTRIRASISFSVLRSRKGAQEVKSKRAMTAILAK